MMQTPMVGNDDLRVASGHANLQNEANEIIGKSHFILEPTRLHTM